MGATASYKNSTGKVEICGFSLVSIYQTSPILHQELENCEDASVTKEVLSLRIFAEMSFHALYQHETAGASFNDFVWALAVLYTFACRKDGSKQEGESHTDTTHLLIPFFGTLRDLSSAKVSAELDGPKLRLVMVQKAAEGSLLYLDNDANTSRDAFLYHGFVPTTLPHDKTKVFEGLQDLVEWYLSTYGEGVHHSKGFVMRLVESAVQTFDDHLRQDLLKEPTENLSLTKPDYSVGVDGYIDLHMVCALITLFNLNLNQQRSPSNYVLGSLDDITEGDLRSMYKGFTIGNDSILSSEVGGSVCGSGIPHAMDVANKQTLMDVIFALKKRVLTLLDSFSTGLEEDEALLKASLWEGFSDDGGGSHLCETCQWQTEELSFNDYLALQLRVRRKRVLLHALSSFSHGHNLKEHVHANVREIPDTFNGGHAKSTEEFLKWCEVQGAHISENLAVVLFPEESNLTNSSSRVRGVQALQDIEQGETICILPLKMGLFDKASSHLAGADSWHLAAAHLLREKSLGVNSKWASYISILPEAMRSPIYLTPYELKEIQWEPVLRELIQVRRAIKKSFSQLVGQKLAWADFEQYKWAVTMVHSRAFTLPVDDDDEYASYVLMPFMDMINHHFKYQADWMSLPLREGKLEIVAKRHVYKGEQLFASFGPRSNDNLFLYYGFVLENNPFDTAQIFSSFEDGVQWFIALWGSNCDEHSAARAREECRRKDQEDYWRSAQRAIEDYAAGVTEQRPEWWNLVNTWAEYGYEYMQFQPSPSIYVGGIVDPSLLIALEAVAEAPGFKTRRVLEDCKHGECDLKSVKSNLKDFFTCMDETRWMNAKWALHSSLCLEYVSQALAFVDERSRTMLMVKMSLSLRCLEILNSFPTSIEEDKLLLKDGIHGSMHVQLARHYRYIKKLFLKDFIDGVVEDF